MLQPGKDTSTLDAFFQGELLRLGPAQPTTAWSTEDSQAYCRLWAQRHYENFSVGSWLLPSKLRQDFYNVYAFCRWSDNLADEVADRDHSLRLLDWWQNQLSLCYSGRPTHPVLVALQHTIQSHRLPCAPFMDLLSAFRQDQVVLRYEDEQSILSYCQHSANPVGRILLQLGGADNLDNFRLSDRVCTGLQLANFCQDISRDVALDRIYAPRSLWIAHNVHEPQLLARRATPELRAMLAAWVESSRRYLHGGWPLVEQVPRWLATDIDLFVRGGLAILQRIEQLEYDVWTQRPTISKTRKLQLLVQSAWGGYFGRRHPSSDSIPGCIGGKEASSHE